MDAELSRLLSRAMNSPYWRVKGGTAPNGGDLAEWLTAQCVKAGSADNLNNRIKDFLQRCDRSFNLAYEMFQGKMQGSQEEMDRQVVEKVDVNN